MKEPVPDKDGVVRWNGVKFTAAHIEELKAKGYKWNPKGECYDISFDLIKVINSKRQPLEPLSFSIDEFHKSVHAPYGGDCHPNPGNVGPP